jgi:hypothetical protein
MQDAPDELPRTPLLGTSVNGVEGTETSRRVSKDLDYCPSDAAIEIGKENARFIENSLHVANVITDEEQRLRRSGYPTPEELYAPT